MKKNDGKKIIILAVILFAGLFFNSCWFGGTCSIVDAELLSDNKIRVNIEGMDRTGKQFEFDVQVWLENKQQFDYYITNTSWGNYTDGVMWKYYYVITMNKDFPSGSKVYIYAAGNDSHMSGSAVLEIEQKKLN